MSNSTQVCDFSRSYVRWTVDTTIQQPKTVSHKPPFTLNHVRVIPTCLAEVTDTRTGRTVPYLLGGSCKTEHVNVPRDIWTQPNADFSMIAGPDRFLALKRWDKTDKGVMLYPPSLGPQPERQLGNAAEMFSAYHADVRRTSGRVLSGIDDICAAFQSDRPIVARTRVAAPHYTLALEYPVVTGNFSPREKYYQLDTGPVILPDLGVAADAVLPTFQLAFVAHTGADWAEFLLCVPTPLTSEISVHHYSKSVRVACASDLIVIG